MVMLLHPTVTVTSMAATMTCCHCRASISVAIVPMAEEFDWSDSAKGAISSAFFVGCTSPLTSCMANTCSWHSTHAAMHTNVRVLTCQALTPGTLSADTVTNLVGGYVATRYSSKQAGPLASCCTVYADEGQPEAAGQNAAQFCAPQMLRCGQE